MTKAGATATVTVSYYEGGFRAGPALILTLGDDGASDVTYTITHNQYCDEGPKSRKVRAGKHEKVVIDALGRGFGWYDVTLTIDTDPSWSQRYTGHIENGRPSITGAA